MREAAFESLEQEVPYSVAVEIRSFDESRPDLVRIAADLLVERASQKGIVLGKGGEMIKRIGVAARPRIEKLLAEAGLPGALGQARPGLAAAGQAPEIARLLLTPRHRSEV